MRCGLAAGVELERPLLRRLRNELRKAQALEVAGRALVRRDLSQRGLAERLERAGVAGPAGEAALASLAQAGVLDDARVARLRAASLADRGWGDLSIAARLEAEGISAEEARGAIEALAPETVRAARLVSAVSDPRKAWRRLVGRGFEAETIEAVLGALDE